MATEQHPRGREAVRKQADARDRGEVEHRGTSTLFNIPVGARRTDDVWMLRVEAELVDSGTRLGNPARPASEATAKAAIERIEEDGLTPAWRVDFPEDGR